MTLAEPIVLSDSKSSVQTGPVGLEVTVGRGVPVSVGVFVGGCVTLVVMLISSEIEGSVLDSARIIRTSAPVPVDGLCGARIVARKFASVPGATVIDIVLRLAL